MRRVCIIGSSFMLSLSVEYSRYSVADRLFVIMTLLCGTCFIHTVDAQPEILIRRLPLLKTSTCHECRDVNSNCARLVQGRSCEIQGRQILKYICSATCPNVCRPCHFTIVIP
uniref:ShKT domain-containing protein n=1 Tax=Ciona savignyi TaxID=51511 RepID=H2ZJC0_CIOSA